MDRINPGYVNTNYADLVNEYHKLTKDKTASEEQLKEMESKLLKYELELSALEIINSTRFAFI